MKTTEIRKIFLDYFRAAGHEAVPGSPLVPANDPTLLFTNSGMVQFKEALLGLEKRACPRAVTAQRCLRAGGKHNDLENVGYTARHHTFFEMLGNFSFGDYFKKEAVTFAWQLLTEHFSLPPEKLWVTVYQDDDEAADVWLRHVGVDPARLSRIAGDDNFWAMGDSGPCGPCSEIFYDHGPGVAGGPPGSADADGDRYVEIWNLVFMQFNRDSAGAELTPLPQQSVDTGMGLERIAAVLQGVHSNYEIDLFRSLIDAAAQLLGVRDTAGNKGLRVIADHLRSAAFLVTDGVTPTNEGRGYVLRRIIRRAIRHGWQLGSRRPFLHQLVGALADEMGGAYPELARSRARVEKELQRESERFAQTLEQGLKLLEREIADAAGGAIAGDVVFKLYDTYGFPVDLTVDAARERGLRADLAGFDEAMSRQRARGRSSRDRFDAARAPRLAVDAPTRFTGYQTLESDAEITALAADGVAVDSVNGDGGCENGDSVMVVLNATPFYAEAGGQVGDRGVLRGDGGCENGGAEFTVGDTRRLPGGAVAHIGRVRHGTFAVGGQVRACVDAAHRAGAAMNHSATHLLHAALGEVLGAHVRQRGSLVEAGRLRFDFSHPAPLSRAEAAAVENWVNREVRANHPVQIKEMSRDEAAAAGARALFGEKYGERVRVVGMGAQSLELCGGTHVARSGDIGLFKIAGQSAVASGVRRVEAVCGAPAVTAVAALEDEVDALCEELKCSRAELPARVRQLRARGREMERRVQSLSAQLAARGAGAGGGGGGGITVEEVDGIAFTAARVDGAGTKELRAAVDQLRQVKEAAAAVVVVGGVVDGKVNLVVAVPPALTGRVRAGDVAGELSRRVGGRGGGRDTLAMGGGPDAAALDGALAAVGAVLQAAARN